jgi:NADP-dependent aldehyde dehydrogenase
MNSTLRPILSGGVWKASAGSSQFQSINPRTTKPLPDLYPVSNGADVEAILQAASTAFEQMRGIGPEQRAAFLERYATEIDQHKEQLAVQAELETALPQQPRLLTVEIPRTVDQLRQAAAAARDRSWTMATIDTKNNLRSMYIPLGPAVIFGPNNFPFAYSSVSGGDFAAAIAAGNPVIAKGHPAHPATTRLLAELAVTAIQATQMPPALLQLVYHLAPEDGASLVGDARVGSVAFTGSRHGGLALKAIADKVGKPIFLEMGSLNPVVILPGALAERADEVFTQVSGSCLMGMGQFCTNPGILLFVAGEATNSFVRRMQEYYRNTAIGTLLTETVQKNLSESVDWLHAHGAELLAGGKLGGGEGFSYQHTLLKVSAAEFLDHGTVMQREAFGNATLIVLAQDVEELAAVLATFEGQLCGSIYSHRAGADDTAYQRLAPILRQKVGRLLNDKMPTGVLVSSAQNHGGPFPATGHPHFTAVGFPASLRRFAMLAAYDNVRPHRLPPELADKNPTGQMWRLLNNQWSQADVTT